VRQDRRVVAEIGAAALSHDLTLLDDVAQSVTSSASRAFCSTSRMVRPARLRAWSASKTWETIRGARPRLRCQPFFVFQGSMVSIET
jgi:hypothetical protein